MLELVASNYLIISCSIKVIGQAMFVQARDNDELMTWCIIICALPGTSTSSSLIGKLSLGACMCINNCYIE